MAGIAVLTLHPGGLAFGYGESLTLLSAVVYALHIVGLGAWSDPDQAMGMAILQLAVISVVCFVGAVTKGNEVPDTSADWVSNLFMSLVSGDLAMAGQSRAQAHTSPPWSPIIERKSLA